MFFSLIDRQKGAPMWKVQHVVNMHRWYVSGSLHGGPLTFLLRFVLSVDLSLGSFGQQEPSVCSLPVSPSVVSISETRNV